MSSVTVTQVEQPPPLPFSARLLASVVLNCAHSSPLDADLRNANHAPSVFYIVSLVILSIRIHRHRKAGGHCKPTDIEHAAPQAYNPNAVEQAEKISVQPQTQAYPVQTGVYYPPQ